MAPHAPRMTSTSYTHEPARTWNASCPRFGRLNRTSEVAPPGLPFSWESGTILRGLNFTLTTGAGDIDLLGEITGGGTYDDLVADTEVIEVFGVKCFCLSLERLITVKRAAGLPKDLETIAELEAIAEERKLV